MCFASTEEGDLCLGDREASQRRWYLDSLKKKSLHPLFIGTFTGVAKCHYWDRKKQRKRPNKERGGIGPRVMQRWFTGAGDMFLSSQHVTESYLKAPGKVPM